MFEGNNSGIYLGGMIRNYHVSEANRRAAVRAQANLAEWRDYAAELEGKLDWQENETKKANSEIAKANIMIAERDARIAALEAEVARLSKVAQDSQMEAEGRLAQFDAFAAQHPDSPLMADSGKRFKSGKIKTKARLIYEAAFDAHGRNKLGISNPADRRVD
ncbi:hypothetical protein GBZ48_18380 [Azospirillum melinis]|uniref:Uncharacterized protein n=1 Tax=Azospirillum melinis TaxID=328839 RepID=A0ABX2KKT1_9PROT|nr:hypothetical protein [Azospirillum melinis]MBP2309718.1 uncharacterized small protein (DUF1192 family) [Azospirillum melinis]NUB01237.1 hypothetical protein [Azospirillum melinis]